ncbi:MAG: hypothetical protein JNL07_00910, partial [Rhodospirillales bacterium]|nr:hypothetical protein [Rhodospirillales bacterium]
MTAAIVRTTFRAALAALALGAASVQAQKPAADAPVCVPAAPTGAVRSLRGPDAAAPAPVESAFLAERVKEGQLPPVDKRLPATPYVVTEFAGPDGPGAPGGEINL